jgi:hypothetical protein
LPQLRRSYFAPPTQGKPAEVNNRRLAVRSIIGLGSLERADASGPGFRFAPGAIRREARGRRDCFVAEGVRQSG